MGSSESKQVLTSKSEVPESVTQLSTTETKECANEDLISALEDLDDLDTEFKQICVGERDLNQAKSVPFKHEFIIFLYSKKLKQPLTHQMLKYFKYLKFFRIDLMNTGLTFNTTYLTQTVKTYFENEEYKYEKNVLNPKITHDTFIQNCKIKPSNVINAIRKIEHKCYNIKTWNCQHFVKHMLQELGLDVIVKPEAFFFFEMMDKNEKKKKTIISIETLKQSDFKYWWNSETPPDDKVLSKFYF